MDHARLTLPAACLCVLLLVGCGEQGGAGGKRQKLPARIQKPPARIPNVNAPSVKWPKGSVLGRLFRQPDDYILINGIHDPLGRLAETKGLSSLTPVQQNTILVIRASGVVGNGGFQYFFEAKVHEGEKTVAALKAMGATAAAEALAHALSIFPNGKPHEDLEKRDKFLMGLTDSQRSEFEKGHEHLYHWVLQPVIANYIRRNEQAYTDLRDPTDTTFPLEPPARTATDRQMAKWIQSMGGRCEFEGYVYKTSGWRKLFYEGDSMPKGKLTLKAASLPGSRRDIDKVIAHLAGWKKAAQIDEVLIERAFWLTRNGLSALGAMPGLKTLDLSASPVNDSNIGSLRPASRLEKLVLKKTTVTDKGLLQLVHLKQLRSLDVTQTSARGQSLNRFGGLRELVIGWLALTDPGLSFIEQMPKLEILTVDHIRLLPEAIQKLAGLERLKSITLWNNGLTEDQLGPLKGHTSLSRINLQGIRITAKGARTLASLPIKWMMLGPISKEARQILLKALPKAEVYVEGERLGKK